MASAMRMARSAGSGTGTGIVEEDHHAVAGEALERALVLHDERAHLGVVFAEDAHDFLGLGGLRERGEAAEVEEHDRDLAPVGLERIVGAAGHDELGELGREEALEAAELLELADLLLDAALERPVPLGALLGEILHGVVEVLDPQHRLDPGHQRRLIHGLRQVLVAPGFEAGDDVLGIRLGRDQDDRDEGKRRHPPGDAGRPRTRPAWASSRRAG